MCFLKTELTFSTKINGRYKDQYKLVDRSDFYWTEVTFFFVEKTELTFSAILVDRSVVFPTF